MDGSILEVAVIGAGHAGLTVSYYLKHLGLEHMIFERGRVGDSWRTQRWDNFRMNTSNKLNALPGSIRKIASPESFYSATEYAGNLEDYAQTFQLPINENAEVLSIEKPEGSPFFVLTVSHYNDGIRKHNCWQVIVTTGGLNQKKVPLFSSMVSTEIKQLHASEYKLESGLPEGGVLVVGSGQSGSQIADDLINAGREVFLSTSAVPRMPRRYRGRDIFDWLIACKFLECGPGEREEFSAEIGHTTSLQYLAVKGVNLLGRMDGISQEFAVFKDDAADNMLFADQFSDQIKKLIDDHILKNSVEVGEEEVDQSDISAEHIQYFPGGSLNLKHLNIRTIVWATGFKGDFSFVKLPVLDGAGNPLQQNGVTSVEGLYFMGHTPLRSIRSSFIFGIKDDAGFITNKVYSALR